MSNSINPETLVHLAGYTTIAVTIAVTFTSPFGATAAAPLAVVTLVLAGKWTFDKIISIAQSRTHAQPPDPSVSD